LPSRYLILNDYYDAFEPKLPYFWPPLDIVYLSGMKNSKTLDFSKMKARKCIAFIKRYSPDILIVSSAYPCLKDELKILSELKIPYILSNTNYGSLAKALFENNHLLKGILLYPDAGELEKFLSKDQKSDMILTGKEDERKNKKKVNFSRPDIKVFLNRAYKLPFFKGRFALIAASYGCPGKCIFCALSGLEHYERSAKEVLEEMKYLYKKGIRNFYFQDPDFFCHSEWEKILSIAPLDSKISIQGGLWRRRIVKKDYWRKVVNVRTGIESATDKLLKIQNKIYDRKILYDNIKALEGMDVSTIGFYIIGLPGEKKSDFVRSIFDSIRLSPTFITISAFTIDPGSSYFEEDIKGKGIRHEGEKFGRSSMGIPFIKRIIWYSAFYLRISSLKRIIRFLGSLNK